MIPETPDELENPASPFTGIPSPANADPSGLEACAVRALTRRLALVALPALAAVLVGCTSPLAPQQDDLSSARGRWRAAELDDYTFDLQRFCFCGPDALRVARIVVEGGEAVSATWIESGEPIENYPFGKLPTIDDLFAEIQDAIDREAVSLEATYDRALGHPIMVSIDYSLSIADEERSFEVSAVGAIPHL